MIRKAAERPAGGSMLIRYATRSGHNRRDDRVRSEPAGPAAPFPFERGDDPILRVIQLLALSVSTMLWYVSRFINGCGAGRLRESAWRPRETSRRSGRYFYVFGITQRWPKRSRGGARQSGAGSRVVARGGLGRGDRRRARGDTRFIGDEDIRRLGDGVGRGFRTAGAATQCGAQERGGQNDER